MKVLHIPTGGLLPDGIYSCIAAYFAAINRDDLSLTLLATNSPSPAILEKAKKLDCGIKVIGGRKENPAKYALSLYRYLKQERFDIVHVHGSSAIMSIELMAAKMAGCKVRIAHSHNTTCDNRKADKLLRPIFNHAYTHAFACGNDAGRWLFRKREFTVIPNGRDLNKFKFDESQRQMWRNKFGVSDTTRVYAHVGRFNYQKNHEYLIRIFNDIAVLEPNSHLVLVGTGENMEDIVKMVRELGLTSKVTFTGAIDNVHELLSAFDIMLLPSRFEGLPLVMIEWQANGLTCIASDQITDECIITQWAYTRDITETPRIWCDLARTCRLPDRVESSRIGCEQLRERGYDIQIEAQHLKELYRRLIKEASK